MKKSKLLSIALLASLALTSAKVWADDEPKQDADFKDTPAAVSVADVEALNNRLNALEKSNVKIDALIQFWYTQDSYASTLGSNDYASSKSQWSAFSFRRGEISLGSTLGNDPKVSWLVKLDPTQSSFNGLGVVPGTALSYAGNSGPGASLGNINPFTLVKDLYVKVAYSPYATLILGQNKFAQELEGRWASNDADFNNLSNLAASFGNKRDAGVQLAGSDIPLGPVAGQYVLSVIQGSGQSTADNNVDKDLAAQVGFTYDKNLYIGTSAYDGWEVNGARWDFGLEGRWVYNGFKLQAEFIEGSVNTNDNSSANDSVWTPSSVAVIPASTHFSVPSGQINPTAYYLLASYRLGDFRLGSRWDGYNFNQVGVSGGSNQELDTITFGLDWFQDKDALKWSANFEDHLIGGVDAYQVYTIQSQLYI